jgi:hypothetical protein
LHSGTSRGIQLSDSNKVEWSIGRSAVEEFATRTFSEKEWAVVASEIENILDHYFWTDLPFVIDQLPDLVAEHELWGKTAKNKPGSTQD